MFTLSQRLMSTQINNCLPHARGKKKRYGQRDICDIVRFHYPLSVRWRQSKEITETTTSTRRY